MCVVGARRVVRAARGGRGEEKGGDEGRVGREVRAACRTPEKRCERRVGGVRGSEAVGGGLCPSAPLAMSTQPRASRESEITPTVCHVHQSLQPLQLPEPPRKVLGQSERAPLTSRDALAAARPVGSIASLAVRDARVSVCGLSDGPCGCGVRGLLGGLRR